MQLSQQQQQFQSYVSSNYIVFKGKSKREDVSVHIPNGFDNTELLEIFYQFEQELKSAQVEYNKSPLQQNILEFYAWDPVPVQMKNIIRKEDKMQREKRREEKQLTQNTMDEEQEDSNFIYNNNNYDDSNKENSKQDIQFLNKYLPQSQVQLSQEISQKVFNNTQDSINFEEEDEKDQENQEQQGDSEESYIQNDQQDGNAQKKFSKYEIEQYFRKNNRKKQLWLNVIYIDRDFFSNFETLVELNSFLEINEKQNCKNILILENIQNMAHQNAIKQRMKNGNHGFSEEYMQKHKEKFENEGEEGKGRLSEKIINEDLQEWLCQLYLDLNYDVIETTCKKEGLMALCNCVKVVSEVNSISDSGLYDPKVENIDKEKAEMFGIKDQLQLNWVNMLKTVYLCSDEKAASIALVYNTPKDLIASYMELDSIKERKRLLENINIVPDLEKKIGKAMSEKIYNILTQNEPEQMVNFNYKTK